MVQQPRSTPASRDDVYHRRYSLHLILGKGIDDHLYDWSAWKHAARTLDPLIRRARGRPAVRSIQTNKEKTALIRFPRLAWNEKSHMAWTHASPLTEHVSRHWVFTQTEVWVPGWTVVRREQRAPDICVIVESWSYAQHKPFDQACLLAVGADLDTDVHEALIPEIVKRLALLMNSVLTAKTEAPWGDVPTVHGLKDEVPNWLLSGLSDARSLATVPLPSQLPGTWQPVAP